MTSLAAGRNAHCWRFRWRGMARHGNKSPDGGAGVEPAPFVFSGSKVGSGTVPASNGSRVCIRGVAFRVSTETGRFRKRLYSFVTDRKGLELYNPLSHNRFRPCALARMVMKRVAFGEPFVGLRN
jgi:hypothetical protein